ncbi:GHKL domain-containing protein [Bacillus sp. FJAT-29790]|uniref:histidine kinase N-terminal domain-containing protein n=1 Tax=Bacillus sp. FJAT-29790 TaxID=1895002 RepID=UPI001C244F18|nr:histidine kinase N-terminal domain-containing protein [Bacillus sp. FJAT-29790]MBU8880057.1 GHKL domain-containing protein [Bacillus sp. FJAT-29790]
MFTKTNEKILAFLHENKELLLLEWGEKKIISKEEPFKHKMQENGELMFYLVYQSLMEEDDELEERIRTLAHTVADQRVEAEVNLGEFVYNVNLGRSIIQNYLNKMRLSRWELQEQLEHINSCFDRFLYYSVSHYSDVKNQIIQEKTQFIDTSHKDRLTLLGQMTSSFIHEFRNPLTSVQGFIQLLKAENPEMKYLDIISIELGQLNFQISQFLLLSKKELIGKEKITFSLNELLEEVLIFLYPSILDGKVTIVKNWQEEIYLHGYADEIRQVLINIIFNAIDVLNPFTTDPLIEINCYQLGDSHVKLNIANNGPRIPADIVQSIFEPFVTTKTLGTGLGLFVCKEIIEKHKGNLTCETQSEMTVFSITLPIAEGNEFEADSSNA